MEKRKGGTTKVPYNPKTGFGVSVDEPNTFSDFYTALAQVEKYGGRGIRVAKKLTGIEIDHCIIDGVVLLWTDEIVSHFNNAYKD